MRRLDRRIHLKMTLAKKMNGRVKPGHDYSLIFLNRTYNAPSPP